MKKDFVELTEDVSASPLYSKDLAPTPAEERTWGTTDLAAIWVGMAVCIPTYLLASYMITVGLLWYEALAIIVIANLVVSLPMVLNGHAGVKYGIPFPVLGRASFGIYGVHIPSIARGLVACGWFGVQTWIGGLAIYGIWEALSGSDPQSGLNAGKFIGFGVFWLINIFFIWKGTESIRWLEKFSAPILVIMGIALIIWGSANAGSFGAVLDQSKQLNRPTAVLNTNNDAVMLQLNPLKDVDGKIKAQEFQVSIRQPNDPGGQAVYRTLEWRPLGPFNNVDITTLASLNSSDLEGIPDPIKVRFRMSDPDNSSGYAVSSEVTAKPPVQGGSKLRLYLFWLTAMVGFWATMSISIADITRFAKTQKDQVIGQFMGLPGSMALYSFVGIFVTCAALVNFGDILVGEDAPWDPVTLISRFNNPVVVVVAQFFMLIATLSTNIAANVIAPANAFANALPKLISFRMGGLITGILGIVIMPWWLLNQISNLLIFVSGLLGPVLGILVADYYLHRKTNLSLGDLFKTNGVYRYSGGVNPAAVIAFAIGVVAAYIGNWVKPLAIFYEASWFTGSLVSVAVYLMIMKLTQPTDFGQD